MAPAFHDAPTRNRTSYRSLASPEVLKPRRTQLGVSDGVLNVFVSKIRLERPRIVPTISQCKSTSMSQHVRMHSELKLGLLAQSGDHLRKSGLGERRAPFRCEYEG